jgi:hypothetical protein
VKMVDKHSSRLGLHESETVIGLDSTHAGMIRFPDQQCPNYGLVLEQIKYITESVTNYSTLESRTVSSANALTSCNKFDMLSQGSYFPFDLSPGIPTGSLEVLKGYVSKDTSLWICAPHLVCRRRADKWFEDLDNEVDRTICERLNGRAVPVRVAIIDTGIDANHPLIVSHLPRIRERQSFIPNHDGTEDEHGHGTYVAHILLKTAPRAHLFVAKAFADGREGEMERNAHGIAEVASPWFSIRW